MKRTLLILTLLFSVSALADEARLERDSSVNLDALRSGGKTVVSISHPDSTYRVDASAVLSNVDFDRLVAASSDYNRYVQMGMPNLKESHVVDTDEPANELWVWSKMQISVISSQHYLEVQLLPDLAGGAKGMQWHQVPKQPDWNYEASSKFDQLDGSFYVEPEADGTIYVRYFLAVRINAPLPDGLIQGIVKNNLRSGVIQVIQVLAQQAANKP
ncbi:MAG: hypothetical protein ACXWP5_05735 [Bdellovibrionota bacterium]